jgi:hypothetical protein
VKGEKRSMNDGETVIEGSNVLGFDKSWEPGSIKRAAVYGNLLGCIP